MQKRMAANTTKINEMVENVVIQGRKFASIMIQTYLCVGFLVANLGRQARGRTYRSCWLVANPAQTAMYVEKDVLGNPKMGELLSSKN